MEHEADYWTSTSLIMKTLKLEKLLHVYEGIQSYGFK